MEPINFNDLIESVSDDDYFYVDAEITVPGYPEPISLSDYKVVIAHYIDIHEEDYAQYIQA
jgi:hypothetical protein